MAEAAHFVVINGPGQGREFSVPANGSVSIGRVRKNDVIFDDIAVSRYHCRIFFKDDGLWVSDLASANQTLVNDHAIDEQRLSIGDTILIGESVVKFVSDGRVGWRRP